MPKKTFTAGEVLRAADVNEYLSTSRNVVINSGFDVWQRGDSFTGLGFTADRWNFFYSPGTGFTRTISKLALAPADASTLGGGAKTALRFFVNTAGSGNDGHIFQQKIENVETLAGQPATLSGWFRNNTSVAQTFTFNLRQNFGTGGSATVFVGFLTFTIPANSGWVRYSGSLTFPSIAGKAVNTNDSYVDLWVTFVGNRAINVDMYGIQLEEGTVATPYARNAPSVQAELAACQRYYLRFLNEGLYTVFAQGIVANTTVANMRIPLKVTMRAKPSATIDWSGNGSHYSVGTGTITGFTIEQLESSTQNVTVQAQGTGFSPGFGTLQASNNTSAYIGFGAEL